MKVPADVYVRSPRVYRGLQELVYPVADRVARNRESSATVLGPSLGRGVCGCAERRLGGTATVAVAGAFQSGSPRRSRCRERACHLHDVDDSRCGRLENGSLPLEGLEHVRDACESLFVLVGFNHAT
jgi:hypothetical protein